MEINMEMAREWLVSYGPHLLGALVIFIVGLAVAKVVQRTLRRGLSRAQFDEMLSVFLSRLAYMLVLAFVVILTLGRLGVDTTSFAAVIAAGGLAVGLALQGSLGNFASGVMLIALRPFKVGDYVEVGGVSGTVRAVAVFATELLTPDNRKIIVPNGTITSGNIINYSAEPTRRVDLEIGIGYEDDVRKAKNILEKILAADSRILKEPAPAVAVSGLGESSVNFVVRPWVKSEDYWSVKCDLTERIKLEFDQQGVSIPYPQRDVHLHQVAERKPA